MRTPDPVQEPTTCGVARLTVPLTKPAPDPIQVSAVAGIVSTPDLRSSAARTVKVTVDNYSGVVNQRIWQPARMGTTDLASALLVA